MAFSVDTLFVSTGGSVCRIDTNGNQVGSEVPLSGASNGCIDGSGIAWFVEYFPGRYIGISRAGTVYGPFTAPGVLPQTITASGTKIWMDDDAGIIHRIDVSNPSVPVNDNVAVNLTTSERCFTLMSANLLAVALTNGTLQTVDITNPSSPIVAAVPNYVGSDNINWLFRNGPNELIVTNEKGNGAIDSVRLSDGGKNWTFFPTDPESVPMVTIVLPSGSILTNSNSNYMVDQFDH